MFDDGEPSLEEVFGNGTPSMVSFGNGDGNGLLSMAMSVDGVPFAMTKLDGVASITLFFDKARFLPHSPVDGNAKLL